MNLQLDLIGGADLRRGRIEWTRHPAIVGAWYEMTVDGTPTGFWVKHCGHQTAIRPYYVELPCGDILDRKYSHLADAKAAAVAARNGEPQS